MRIRSGAILLLLALAHPAWAEDPWSVGVTQAQKATAQRLLEQGNALFLDKKWSEALDEYKQALTSWDHPSIRFNMVRCLIQLDRPVEASDNLELALKFGAAPLQEPLYTEALSYKKLLANQIGDLQVSCTQVGVELTVDGHHTATCPSTQTHRVAPGQHQVVATKEGFLTRTIDIVVLGGKHQQLPIDLEPLAKAARVTHRWASWKPWLIFGAGAATVGVGAVIKLKSVSDMNSYDRQVARECPSIACDPSVVAPIGGLKSSAALEGSVAFGMIVAGAAGIVIGGVTLYMNRSQTIYPSAREHAPMPMVDVTPMRGGATVSLNGSF